MQGKGTDFQRKKEKTTALLLAAVIVALSLTGFSCQYPFGICPGGTWTGRFLYPFFHASILHAVLNVWCLVCLVFVYDIKLSRILMAYLGAVTFPADALSQFLPIPAVQTVGLSGVVFFLFGSISFEVERRLYYLSWMLFYLAIGFLFPHTNGWLHLYCYLCGVILAVLNYPIVR